MELGNEHSTCFIKKLFLQPKLTHQTKKSDNVEYVHQVSNLYKVIASCRSGWVGNGFTFVGDITISSGISFNTKLNVSRLILILPLKSSSFQWLYTSSHYNFLLSQHLSLAGSFRSFSFLAIEATAVNRHCYLHLPPYHHIFFF